MKAQFILNLFIAFLWTLFSGQMTVATFAFGYMIGVVIVFLMHRFFGERFYLVRLWAFIKLILLFLVETFQSFFWVAKFILNPKAKYRPGIFKYDTKLESDWEITAISMLITLTPGSVVMEVSPDRKSIYLHGMDLTGQNQVLLSSLEKFEKAIMEVTR